MFLIDQVPPRLVLGTEGDKDVTKIRFDISAWLHKIPTAEFTVNFQNGQVQFDARGVTQENGVLVWSVGDDVTSLPGTGSIVITATGMGVRKCTSKIGTVVSPGHVLPKVVPAESPVATLPAANPGRLGSKVLFNGVEYQCVLTENKYVWEEV